MNGQPFAHFAPLPVAPRQAEFPHPDMPRFLARLAWFASAFAPLLPAAAASAPDPIEASFKREMQPLLDKYCYDCHGNGNDKGGITLDAFTDAASLRDHTLWARALRNVRTGLMPPVEEGKLSAADAEKMMTWIKRQAFGLDPAQPDPGRVVVRRLNRAEYRNTIRDLIGVDYDTQKEFPADDTGHGFDNIGAVLTISPMLLEKYLDAAQAIVARSVPTQPRVVAEATVPGKAFATVKIDTTIPEQPKPATPSETPVAAAAAPTPPANPASATPVPAAAPAPGQALLATNQAGAPAVAGQPARGRGGLARGGRGFTPPPLVRPAPAIESDGLDLSYYTPVTVTAKHTVAHAGHYELAINLRTLERYVDNVFDLNKCRLLFFADGEKLLDQEFVREGAKTFDFTFPREWQAGEHELTFEIQPVLPAQPPVRLLRLRLNGVTVKGPLEPQHWIPPAGYAKVFPREVPADAAGRQRYARELLEKFATRAYRRPVDTATLDRLVRLAETIYAQPKNTFEAGIAQAMTAILASPSFLFREESTEPLSPGQAHPAIDEFALASRLSYFLWSSMPDEELFRLAREQKLRANLTAQLRRMLADPKANELVRNFTGQWLQARDIATVQINPLEVALRDTPNAEYEAARETIKKLQAKPFNQRTPEEQQAAGAARQLVFGFERQARPALTDDIRRAMRQETEMTFAHVLQEDRSVLELLESDYTFLNEDLAKFYGIEGVTGPKLRKVTLPPDSPRGGVLTQGTVLAVTSNPTRTSPVKRGVFILNAILGTPPAPPPPNIPALEDAASAEEIKALSLRETLALHAKNPSCAACHLRMDPLGLALENFNAQGGYREKEMNQPVQPAGKLITGESFANVRELKHVLATAHRRDFYYCLSEKLLTYALGRGLEYYDTVTLDALVAQLEASGGKPSALLQAIVTSAPFQQRRQASSGLSEATPRPASPRLAATPAPLSHE